MAAEQPGHLQVGSRRDVNIQLREKADGMKIYLVLFGNVIEFLYCRVMGGQMMER